MTDDNTNSPGSPGADGPPTRGSGQQKPRIGGPANTHFVVWLMTVGLFIYYVSSYPRQDQPETSYSRFKSELRNDNVAEVTLRDTLIYGKFRDAVSLRKGDVKTYQQFSTVVPSIEDVELMPLLEKYDVEVTARTDKQSIWISVLLSMLPWLLIIGFLVYSRRVLKDNFGGGGGAFSFGQSKARHYDAASVDTVFGDVAGLDNAKRDLQEIIGFLKSPEKYRQLGAKMPRGILMMGPPGCGKTLLAKATAGEAGVPFFSVSGSEFIEMYVGVGASRVRDMFKQARAEAPSLIFIDEIDSIGRVRGTGLGGGHDEREQTLNQILAEMDGFASTDPVVVLAATNRPDVLDPALLRPGRFDRKLVLELPHRQAREAILKLHAGRTAVVESLDFTELAAETVGFSGADLANLVNEAALNAARQDKTVIEREDFQMARDKIILGDISGQRLTEVERQRVACHESGHALAALFQPGADPLKRITIIPRGRALGATEQMPSEDRHNYIQSYLETRVIILLAGRCAEQLVFGELSSGAADDLKQATELARQMITQWGMNEALGPVNLQQGEMHPFLGREISEPKKFSEDTARLIDEEVRCLINRCQERVQVLLEKHRDDLDRLAAALIEEESLDHQSIVRLLKLDA